MIETGNIITTETPGKPDTHEWEGPPVVHFTYEFIEAFEGDIKKQKFDIGPYSLRNLGSGWAFGFDGWGIVAIRTNGTLNIRIRSAVIWLRWWLHLINARLLRTARIWELLDTKEGERFSWSDLKFLKRIRSWRHDGANV